MKHDLTVRLQPRLSPHGLASGDSIVVCNSHLVVRYTLIMDLSDPYLKTARAKEHLDALQKELESFYNSKPYEIQGKVNNKEGLCQIRIQVKDPPNRLSIIAGDILSCLRASPDHLVWLLATNNAASYAGRTQFPIMEVNESSSFKGPDCK